MTDILVIEEPRVSVLEIHTPGPKGEPGMGATLDIQDEGNSVLVGPDFINFKGVSVTATLNGAGVDVTVTGGSTLDIKDEGSLVTNSASGINFKGAGVTASLNGTEVDVNIPYSLSGLIGEFQYNSGSNFGATPNILYGYNGSFAYALFVQPLSITQSCIQFKSLSGQTADVVDGRDSGNVQRFGITKDFKVVMNPVGVTPAVLSNVVDWPVGCSIRWGSVASFGYISTGFFQFTTNVDVFGSVLLRQSGSRVRMTSTDSTGTPGNVSGIINAKGRVTIPIGSSTLTVTLSTSNATVISNQTLVMCTMQTVDGGNFIKAVTHALPTVGNNGSFTIHLDAVAGVNINIGWAFITD